MFNVGVVLRLDQQCEEEQPKDTCNDGQSTAAEDQGNADFAGERHL